MLRWSSWILSWICVGSLATVDQQWSTIKGQVICRADLPEAKELAVIADRDHCQDKGKIIDETWVVNKSNRGVKNVFVWLASDGGTASGRELPVHPSLKQLSAATVEVDQPHCRFVPHVVAIREGQTLVVKNSSPITHNVRWESANALKNRGDNKSIASGKSIEIGDLRQDRLPLTVSCSIHPWMKGFVRVFDSPYFAITDGDGRFEIKLAPTGKHRVFLWHEGSGWKGGAAGKSGEVFEIRPDVTDFGQLEIKP